MKTVDERMEAIYGGGWQDLMAYVRAIKVVYENLKEMQAEIDRLQYEKDEAVKRLLSYQEMIHKEAKQG